ncbi:MAG: short-chain dehydrogenase/reductase [Bryobacterales bacterium]|nr:short-chain dehydrogenase/reductase [Bryobacterales bacterium]
MRLQGKTAIITGAGAGIGRATAVRFAEEGANLLLADINDAEIKAAAEEVAALGAQVATVTGDISLEETAIRISQVAAERFGGIDILVNNAANFTTAPVETATVEQWRKVLDINVIGTALVTKHAIPYLKKSGNGSIVNISSTSAVMAQPNFATYNTTKGALLSMTICSALDLSPFNIRVNSICPGCIYTTASEREWTRMGQTREEWSAEMAKQHMLGRVGEPREVANAILFFASDEASFITGAHLFVDGGRVAQ